MNFIVRKNSTVGIVGESGSGKSTVGKAVIGLLDFEGEIIFNGTNLGNLSQRERQDLKDVQNHISRSFWFIITSNDSW